MLTIHLRDPGPVALVCGVRVAGQLPRLQPQPRYAAPVRHRACQLHAPCLPPQALTVLACRHGRLLPSCPATWACIPATPGFVPCKQARCASTPTPLPTLPPLKLTSGSKRTASVNLSQCGATRRRSSRCIRVKPPTWSPRRPRGPAPGGGEERAQAGAVDFPGPIWAASLRACIPDAPACPGSVLACTCRQVGTHSGCTRLRLCDTMAPCQRAKATHAHLQLCHYAASHTARASWPACS